MLVAFSHFWASCKVTSDHVLCKYDVKSKKTWPPVHFIYACKYALNVYCIVLMMTYFWNLQPPFSLVEISFHPKNAFDFQLSLSVLSLWIQFGLQFCCLWLCGFWSHGVRAPTFGGSRMQVLASSSLSPHDRITIRSGLPSSSFCLHSNTAKLFICRARQVEMLFHSVSKLLSIV